MRLRSARPLGRGVIQMSYIKEKIMDKAYGARNYISPNDVQKLKDIKFMELLRASSSFFAWYNKTYKETPSNNEEHPWVKLGAILDKLQNETDV